MFWALKPGECPKGTILAGARKNRANQMQFKRKTVSWNSQEARKNFVFVFFVRSLPEFWRPRQEKRKCCQDAMEPKRKLKFRQISCDTFIFSALGKSLAGGSQKESCHWFPQGKACIPCPALNKFDKYACQTVSLGTGTKLLLAWLEFTPSEVKG